MRENAHLPARPTGGGTPSKAGFTKYEAVVLEFAKELIIHYSNKDESPSFWAPEIMKDAQTLAEQYFTVIERRKS